MRAKKIRSKLFALQFTNELLKKETTILVEAKKESEAIELATLQLDAYKTEWYDDYCEFHTLKNVKIMEKN